MENLNLLIHIVYEHYLNMLSILIKNASILNGLAGGCRSTTITLQYNTNRNSIIVRNYK